MPISECPSARCRTNNTKGRLCLQVRGSKFTKFQEVRSAPFHLPVWTTIQNLWNLRALFGQVHNSEELMPLHTNKYFVAANFTSQWLTFVSLVYSSMTGQDSGTCRSSAKRSHPAFYDSTDSWWTYPAGLFYTCFLKVWNGKTFESDHIYSMLELVSFKRWITNIA